jgi:UDP-N-acetylglucosamine--N-acetylmuramyl-(pentapeptide) pyrophosphoryl-undecaprenol N-acetylglucosamine transferase
VKIVMACGGSGGHIFPAISVAEEISQRLPSSRILFACGKKEIEETIFKGIPKSDVIEIDSAAFLGGRALWKPLFLLKLVKGFLDARAFLKRERPDLVAGFGGYFSFPVVLASKSLGIKCMVHEQNVVPGLANKVLASWVHGVALSFEETKKLLPGARRATVTGNPIRSFIMQNTREEAMRYFNFSHSKKTLLVLGGSQGAESINRFFLECLKFLPADIKAEIQVLHLCGRMDSAQAEKACQAEGIPCRAYAFFDRMDLAYGAADLALGRAGATFLAEIQAKKVPAILIPYPYAGGHQKENAKVFQASNQATILEQETLNAEQLAGILEGYMRKVVLRSAGEFMVPAKEASNARTRLADFMLNL